MKGQITAENDQHIGLDVTDNNEIVHDLTLQKYSGSIEYHEQDGYPDKTADRTFEENEHVAQAQRFAKYHVYRQRGYDTMPPLPNPDRISAVAAFVDSLSLETFEEYFGEYYQQMLSHYDRADPVVEIPDEAQNNPLYYRKDVYLDVSIERLQSLVTDADQSAFEILQSEHELSLEAVSGVHVMWSPASNQTETITTDEPDIDRKPDARFELPPYEPESLEDFRDHLIYHLRCQIRDCYLTMGVAPPEDLRIQGPGWFDRSTWFQHYDVYEPYHRTDVDITDWQVESTPEEMLA